MVSLAPQASWTTTAKHALRPGATIGARRIGTVGGWYNMLRFKDYTTTWEAFKLRRFERSGSLKL